MISEISMANFGNHSETVVRLESGVNVFIGPNGAGKSMIGDAVCWCLYGESIRAGKARDSRRWKPQEGAGVSVTIGDDVITRLMGNGKSDLWFSGVNTGRIGEIQAMIDSKYGTVFTNKLTRFFHRSKATLFSLASDGERKAIVEDLIGVSAFDSALAVVKAEEKGLKTILADCVANLTSVERSRAYLSGKLDSLRKPDAELYDDRIVSIKRDIAGFKKMISEAGIFTEPMEPDLSSLFSARESLTVDYGAAKSEYDRLFSLGDGICSKCGQKTGISTNDIIVAKEKAKTLLDGVREVTSKIDTATQSYREQKRDYIEKARLLDDLKRRIDMLDRDLLALEKAKKTYDARVEVYMSERADLERKISSSDRNLLDARIGLTAVEDRLNRLAVLEKVFGSKGARVIALSDAFSSIARCATDVLKLISVRNAGLTFDISEDMTSIDMVVRIGAYTGSYGGLSVGQHALFDFALLKALGSLPWTSFSNVPFIYDDIVEAMDTWHKTNVCSFIEQESAGEQVFLFTYDESVADLFSDATVFHVEDGRVLSS